MYAVTWDPKAQDALDKLELSTALRIAKKVHELRTNPFNQDIKKLKGSPLYRLRVGDYRVIFELSPDSILILKVGHRQHIYER